MSNIKIEFKGISNVRRKIGAGAAHRLHKDLDHIIKDGTDATAKKAYYNAPVLTGALRSSIVASVKREGDMNYIFGSRLPYAQRQEYEHKTKRAYFRRAVWAQQPLIGNKIKQRISRMG